MYSPYFFNVKMCIDIEHALKTRLVVAEDNPDENGYNIVDSFLSNNPDVITNIEKKAGSVFTGQLIEKYFKLCTVYFGIFCSKTLKMPKGITQIGDAFWHKQRKITLFP